MKWGWDERQIDKNVKESFVEYDVENWIQLFLSECFKT